MARLLSGEIGEHLYSPIISPVPVQNPEFPTFLRFISGRPKAGGLSSVMAQLCSWTRPWPADFPLAFFSTWGVWGVSPHIGKDLLGSSSSWGQVVKAQHSTFVCGTRLCLGLYELSPGPKRGAGWKSPGTRLPIAATSSVRAFPPCPRPISRLRTC